LGYRKAWMHMLCGFLLHEVLFCAASKCLRTRHKKLTIFKENLRLY
jgi:hypothetical protein